jgi:DNA-directed RNA polymerase specialized sigma54-like protein
MKNLESFEEYSLLETSWTKYDVEYYDSKEAAEGEWDEWMSDVKMVTNGMFKEWKKNPLSDAVLDDELKKEVVALANRFVKKYKKINGNIVLHMIMVLGSWKAK